LVELYEYEIGKAADILVRELFNLKPGETIILTADTESNARVVNATATAAFAAGAKPMVIWLATPLGPGKAADSMLPVKALTAALKEADVWIDFNNQFLLYSTPFEIAYRENKKLRFMDLPGMTPDMMNRCIGRINYPVLKAFLEKVRDMTKAAKHIRVTNPAGTDVEFENEPDRPWRLHTGYATTPGAHMMGGQISWAPKFDSINGNIVFDGSVVPIGVLKEPIKLKVKNGIAEKIEGGSEATEFERWLKSFNDLGMFRMAHISYGFNPGAKLTGKVVEDERVWGCTEWGMGYVGPFLTGGEPIQAASHTDGICLNCSVWLDGEQITDKGKVIHPELVELAKKLGKA